MAYLKAGTVTRVTLPSNSEYWVELKSKLSYGDALAAQKALLNIEAVEQLDTEERDMVTKLESDTYFTTLLLRAIVRWNLDDEDGSTWEITAENIARLENEDGQELIRHARELMRRRPRAQEIPFDRRSRQPSQDARSPALLRP